MPSTPAAPRPAADPAFLDRLRNVESHLFAYSHSADAPLGMWLLFAAQFITTARANLDPEATAAVPLPIAHPPGLPFLRLKLKAFEMDLRAIGLAYRDRAASEWIGKAALWLDRAQRLIERRVTHPDSGLRLEEWDGRGAASTKRLALVRTFNRLMGEK